MLKLLSLIIVLVSFLFINIPPVNAENPKDEYSVGVGDILEINVINEPGLKTTTVIGTDGTINFPYLGTVYVKGMKISEIEKEVSQKLSEGYIKYPVVSVSLLRAMGIKFYIYGEVARSGAYEFAEDITVLKTISMAGGIAPTGLYGKIKVRRKQGDKIDYKDIEIDLKGIVDGGASGDMLLQPDDIVIVERNKTYFIYGEVVAPGEYVLKDDITLVRAISIAGGIRPDGLYGKVKVRRKQDGEFGYKDIEIDLKGIVDGGASGDMLLQPDDIVTVERNKTYFVYGEVLRPGQYVLEDDMTVFKAITLTGGFTKWGSPRRVKLLRPKEGGTEYLIIKLNINAVIDGDAMEDISLQPGDIIIISSGAF